MVEGRRGWFLGCLALLCLSCGGSRLAPADTAARVAGNDIPYADFENYVSDRVGLDSASSSPVLSGLLDQFLDERLVRVLALEEGVAEPDTPGWEVVDALLAAREPAPVSEQEVLSYYRTHRDRFQRSERVVLRQVLAEDEETARRIGEALGRTQDFGELAGRLLSEGVTASEGEIAREDLPPAFVDKIFSLADGEVSDVVAADYGYHVFQVVATMPAEEVGLVDATAEIVEILAQRGHRQRVEQLVAEARASYNVEVYARNLPFNYEGRYDTPGD